MEDFDLFNDLPNESKPKSTKTSIQRGMEEDIFGNSNNVEIDMETKPTLPKNRNWVKWVIGFVIGMLVIGSGVFVYFEFFVPKKTMDEKINEVLPLVENSLKDISNGLDINKVNDIFTKSYINIEKESILKDDLIKIEYLTKLFKTIKLDSYQLRNHKDNLLQMYKKYYNQKDIDKLKEEQRVENLTLQVEILDYEKMLDDLNKKWLPVEKQQVILNTFEKLVYPLPREVYNREIMKTYVRDVSHETFLQSNDLKWFKGLDTLIQSGAVKLDKTARKDKAIDYMLQSYYLDNLGKKEFTLTKIVEMPLELVYSGGSVEEQNLKFKIKEDKNLVELLLKNERVDELHTLFMTRILKVVNFENDWIGYSLTDGEDSTRVKGTVSKDTKQVSLNYYFETQGVVYDPSKVVNTVITHDTNRPLDNNQVQGEVQDQKLVPIKVVINKVSLREKAIEDLIALDNRNRGFDPKSQLELLYINYTVENLSNEPIEIIRGLMLTDDKGKELSRTGVVFGTQETLKIGANETVTVHDWNIAKTVENLQLMWGRGFPKTVEPTTIKVLKNK